MWLRIQDDSKTSRTSLGGDATFCFWFVHETLMWQWQHNNASIGIILLVKRNVMLRSLHLERVGRMIDSTYLHLFDSRCGAFPPSAHPLTTHHSHSRPRQLQSDNDGLYTTASVSKHHHDIVIANNLSTESKWIPRHYQH